MKFVIVIAVAFLACAFADVSELAQPGYDYPQPAPVESYIPPAAPKNEYIPPAAPASEYIPPAPVAAPVDAYIPPAEESVLEEIEQPAQDGYRYKTVRRRVFRHRN
ncbi:CG30458 [Drosophila busckii]|uniref:CG30458 n=1 Tax=Drosophila busckii TaxID=30019 RepID=A0A0M4EBP5_DROBS|nr:protein transport protein sec31 [Drosophila busckii]ALC40990.1 CG30458 [Drosophila busckii]